MVCVSWMALLTRSVVVGAACRSVVLRCAPRSRKWPTVGMVVFGKVQMCVRRRCRVVRFVENVWLLLGASLELRSCMYWCVWSYAVMKSDSWCGPCVVVRMSSARSRGDAGICRWMRIHGRSISAMMSIEKGHPCGMPHFFVCVGCRSCVQ